jgi:excisionase family DNA binding protein
MNNHNNQGGDVGPVAQPSAISDTLYRVPTPASLSTVGPDAQPHAFLTTKEAAAYLRLTRSCLAKWRCAGGGPQYILAGRKVLYAKAVLDSWLASRQRRSTSERK